MKKNILLSIAFLFFALIVTAETRSLDQAKAIAEAFGKSAMIQKSPSATHKIAPAKIAHIAKKGATPLYYVFDNTNDMGFIIVSADTRTEAVLGYAEKGEFDKEDMPVNMRAWLESYEKEIAYIIDNDIETKTPAPRTSKMAAAPMLPKVDPLLKGIKWGQDAPFNNDCPMDGADRSVTGCVATAMAQIMFYHKYPANGKGSSSYNTRTENISVYANFANSTYDWDAMLDAYSSSSSNAAKEAVAQLMFDCGAAVKMDYTSWSSGAYTYEVPKEMVDHFDYDTDIRSVNRWEYDDYTWTDIIKNELQNKRPVLHSGSSDDGAHAFVCDGYNEDEFFHFNWGWDGSYNGYFKLSSLIPAGTDGTGAGSADGYNQEKSIIIGIQKPDGTDEDVEHFALRTESAPKAEKTRGTRTEKVEISVDGLFNYGSGKFDGGIGFGVFDDDLNSVGMIWKFDHLVQPYYGFSTFSVSNFQVSSDIANGDYRIYPVYKADDGDKWMIVKGHGAAINYINITVTNNYVYYNDEPKSNNFSLSADCGAKSAVYRNRNTIFYADITNNAAEYLSDIEIHIDDEIYRYPSTTIRSGETFSVEIDKKITFATGHYDLKVYADNTNSEQLPNTLIGSYDIYVKAEPSERTSFEIVSAPSFSNNNNVTRTDCDLSYEIKNNGGYGRHTYYFSVWNSSMTKQITASDIVKKADLDKNETKVFSEHLNLDIPSGEYIMKCESSDSKIKDHTFEFTYNSSRDITKTIVAEETIEEDSYFSSLTIGENGIAHIADYVEVSTHMLELIIKGDESPEIYHNENLYANEIKVKKYIENDRYYFISLPFNCAVSSIEGDLADIGTYGTDWAIYRYDEAERATNFEAIKNGTAKAWTQLSFGEEMKADKGYIIATASDEEICFVFNQINDTESKLVDEGWIETLVYTDGENTLHNGWNLISIPAYHSTNNGAIYFLSDDVDVEIEIEDMLVSVPKGNGKDYHQGYASDFDIASFSSFFVQVPTSGMVEFYTNEPSSTKNNDFVKPNAMKLNVNGDDATEHIITLKQGAEEKDVTHVIFSEDAPEEYWIGHDLEKMSAFDAEAQIYTLGHDSKLAFNCTNTTETSTINIGIYTPTNEEYSISLDNSDTWVLRDKTTGEMNSVMTFVGTEKGYLDNRYELVEKSTTTDNNASVSDVITVTSCNNEINIANMEGNETVMLYSSNGALVDMRKNDGNNKMTIAVEDAGVYVVRVGETTVKVSLLFN